MESNFTANPPNVLAPLHLEVSILILQVSFTQTHPELAQFAGCSCRHACKVLRDGNFVFFQKKNDICVHDLPPPSRVRNNFEIGLRMHERGGGGGGGGD